MLKTIDIILVSSYQPGSVTRIDIAPPLSILLLMGALEKAGYISQMIDLNLYRPEENIDIDDFYINKISTQISTRKTLIGFSCLTTDIFRFLEKPLRFSKTFFKYPYRNWRLSLIVVCTRYTRSLS